MAIRRWVICVLSLIVLFTPLIYSQPKDSAVASITKSELMKTVKFLASKELAGRLPGSKGYTKAANFISAELHKTVLKPVNGKDYFQKFKVEYNEILAPEHFAVIQNGKRIDHKIGRDYVYRGFTGAGKLTAPVVFCGYGLAQPDKGYDDYSGIDVKGKVVMVFKYNPKWNIDEKAFTNGNPREKAIVAANHGAIGILFTSFPNDAEPQSPIGSVINGEGEQMTDFPEIHIDLPVADELMSGSSYTLKKLQTIIDSTKKPLSVSLVNKVDLEVHTKYEKEKEVVNVVGILEGSDPVLKNEYLIIGAHLDHVGSQAGKIYFPGANDNASGSAALLQIARAFSKSNIRPKRSIAFVFFASEEQGLYGAKFFSNNLPFPKEKVKAMINMDCVGYGDSIQIGGGKSAPELWNIARQIDFENNKLLVPATGNGGGADADPFFEKGIQTLYFVTTNSYKHLHMLSDKHETLNQNLFEAITKLSFRTALRICNR
ncbi:MAG: M20/M25/M40 family metallo-hydrolase [Ignavibacteriales bacterium]|nr:M20/M25/M40 family metallo-hydrolase [Ignavibacteriales bacterium]